MTSSDSGLTTATQPIPESAYKAYMAGFRAARAVIEAGLRVSEEE